MDTIETKDLIIIFISTLLASLINSYDTLRILFYDQTCLTVIVTTIVIMIVSFFICRISIHIKKAAKQYRPVLKQRAKV